MERATFPGGEKFRVSVQFKSVQISSKTERADLLSVQFTLLSRE